MSRPPNRDSGIYGPVKAFSYLTGLAPTDTTAKSPTYFSPTSSVQEASVGFDEEEVDDTGPQSRSSLALNRRPTYYPPDKVPGSSKAAVSASSRYDHYMAQENSAGDVQESRYANRIDMEDARGRGHTNYGSDHSYDPKPRSQLGRDRFPQSPDDQPELFGNFILRGPDDPGRDPAGSRRGGQEEQRAYYSTDAPSSNGGLHHEGRPRTRVSPQEPPSHTRPYTQDSGTDSMRGYDPYERERVVSADPANEEDPYKYNRQLPRTQLDPSAAHANNPASRPLPDKPKGRNSTFPPNGHQDQSRSGNRRDSATDWSSDKGSSSCGKRCKWACVFLVVIVLALGGGFAAGWFIRPIYDDMQTDDVTGAMTTAAMPARPDVTAIADTSSTPASGGQSTNSPIAPSITLDTTPTGTNAMVTTTLVTTTMDTTTTITTT